MLGVHEDTLRNWDAHGLVVADRIGTRKDRRYTAEHVRQIREQGLVSTLARRGVKKKDYSEYTKGQLIKELHLLREQKKFGLVWENKIEEVVEKCKMQAPILKPVSGMNVAGKKDEQKHILIEGDNYHALEVLNYTHKGKIDVIYIDPPYNTGAKNWKYNNDYVEREDSYRHSKWLSMMGSRLGLAKRLLKESGFLICAIDDNEIFTLGLLMDAIFGERNRLGLVTVVHNPKGRNFTKWFSANSEYMLVYAKNTEQAKFNNVAIDESVRESFEFMEEDGRRYRLEPFMRSRTETLRKNKPSFWYPLYVSRDLKKISLNQHPDDYEVYPIAPNGNEATWINLPKTFESKNKQNLFTAQKEGDFIRVYRKFYEQQIFKNIWTDRKYHSEFNGTNLLKEILGENIFDYPKSLYLLEDILKITTRRNAAVLDFFAGSGTTGHAVMELNKEDGGNRQFILCTDNENNNGNGSKGIARGVCQPRIKKVMKGYKKNGDGEKIEGLGGNLEYLKTEFVDVENISAVSDKKKLEFTHQAGYTIALKEDTFTEVEKNDWYQIFTDEKGKFVGVYFREGLEKLEEFEKKILDKSEVKLYVFSYGGNDDWRNDYVEYENVSVESIPEPILRVYKSVNW